jgi:hypothetical protein
MRPCLLQKEQEQEQKQQGHGPFGGVEECKQALQ